ncbi:MAG: type VI secretion system-associated protein TagF [Beijerinckiaceae bacterium]
MKSSASYGLFGKLPAKRDFIALDLPQKVLLPWESWLQQVVAESRQTLGTAWLGAYLKAPLWRFWCGPAVTGQALTGVLMPSVDGVGRYFPLTALAVARTDTVFPAPDGPHDAAAYQALETKLLHALDATVPFDEFCAALRALAVPEPEPFAKAEEWTGAPLLDLGDGDGDWSGQRAGIDGWLAAQGRAGVSVWWTAGGDGFPARMAACNGLPPAGLFTAMLTGVFDGSGMEDAA